jgi:hypothetical protein
MPSSCDWLSWHDDNQEALRALWRVNPSGDFNGSKRSRAIRSSNPEHQDRREAGIRQERRDSGHQPHAVEAGRQARNGSNVCPSHLRAVCWCKTPPAQLYSPRAKGGLRLDQGRRDGHLGSTGRLHPACRRAAWRRAVESWLQRQGVIVLLEPKYVTRFP